MPTAAQGLHIDGAAAKDLANKLSDNILATATKAGVPDSFDGCAQIAHALGVIMRVWQNAIGSADYGMLTAAFATGFRSPVTYASDPIGDAPQQRPALHLIHRIGGRA